MSTKTRNELKTAFAENSVPTAADFADLIDTAVNKTDDKTATLEVATVKATTAVEAGKVTASGLVTVNNLLKVATTSASDALYVKQDGTGNAAKFEGGGGVDIVTSSNATALTVQQTGTAHGAHIVTNRASNSDYVGLYVQETGAGKAAYIWTSNSSNASDALCVKQNGTGNAAKFEGKVVATGLVTANAGLTVSYPVTTGTTTTNTEALTVSSTDGIVTAKKGISVDAISSATTNTNLKLTGQGTGIVTVGDATATDELKVFGPLSATGVLSADTVTSATAPGTGATVGTSITLKGNNGTSTTLKSGVVIGSDANNGTLTVKGDLSVDSIATATTTAGTNLTLKGYGTATAKGGVTIGSDANDGKLTVKGDSSLSTVTASGLVTANAGLTVSYPSGTTTVEALKVDASSGKVALSNDLAVNKIAPNSTATNADLTIAAKGTGKVALSNDLAVNKIAPNSTTTNADLTIAAKGTGTVKLDNDLAVNTIATATTTAGTNLTLKGAGTTTSPGGVTIGSGATDGTLTVKGDSSLSTVTASGLVTANKGLTVSYGTPLAEALKVDASSGLVTVKAGLTVNGTLSFDAISSATTNTNLKLTGQGTGIVTVGDATATDELKVFGPLSATGVLSADTVTSATAPATGAAAGTSITLKGNNGTSTTIKSGVVIGSDANNGSLTVKGAVTANEGLTIGASKSLTFGTTAVKSIATSVSTSSAPADAIPTAQAVRDFINAAIPIGTIVMWSGDVTTIPTGWKLCDGGLNSATGVYRPDLRNKFVLGYKDSNRPIKYTSGEETVTLTPSQIPAHTHNVSISTNTATYLMQQGAVTGGAEWAFTDSGSRGTQQNKNPVQHTHSVTESSVGGGSAHNNMPPYYVLAFIIRES